MTRGRPLRDMTHCAATCYSLDTNQIGATWQTFPSMPAARAYGAMVSLGSSAYWIAGHKAGDRKNVYRYRTADGWVGMQNLPINVSDNSIQFNYLFYFTQSNAILYCLASYLCHQ